MSEQTKSLAQIGLEILQASRNELYMNMPYLDVVLCGLEFRAGQEVTLSLATDGQVLYYNGSFLAERYLRGRVLCNRAYLHVILHCMLRHLRKKEGRGLELWDLACDMAVEYMIHQMASPSLRGRREDEQTTTLALLKEELGFSYSDSILFNITLVLVCFGLIMCFSASAPTAQVVEKNSYHYLHSVFPVLI